MFGLTLSNKKEPILGGSRGRGARGWAPPDKSWGVETWAYVGSREEAAVAGFGP